MTEHREPPRPDDEQGLPGQSPVEKEFVENPAGTPAPRDGITVFGYSMSVILVAVFGVFLVAAALVVLLS